MKKIYIITAIVSLIIFLGAAGCTALSHYIIPADVDSAAVEYVVEAGVADVNEYNRFLFGFPNMAKAEQLNIDIDIAHSKNQFELQQEIQNDNFEYSIHKSIVSSNFVEASKIEEILFGEKGLVSMGLGILGLSAFTGILGLMRKRPGDITPQEMQLAIAQVEGKSVEELSAKTKQFTEVVKGVSIFIEKNKDKLPQVIEEMKKIFDVTQDSDTQLAVASAKQTIV